MLDRLAIHSSGFIAIPWVSLEGGWVYPSLPPPSFPIGGQFNRGGINEEQGQPPLLFLCQSGVSAASRVEGSLLFVCFPSLRYPPWAMVLYDVLRIPDHVVYCLLAAR